MKKEDNKNNNSLWFIPLIFISMFFVRPVSNYFDRLGNPDDIKSLNAGVAFICVSGGGIYSLGNKYVVSKSSGWSSSDGEYFIKDDLIIEIIKCKKK